MWGALRLKELEVLGRPHPKDPILQKNEKENIPLKSWPSSELVTPMHFNHSPWPGREQGSYLALSFLRWHGAPLSLSVPPERWLCRLASGDEGIFEPISAMPHQQRARGTNVTLMRNRLSPGGVPAPLHRDRETLNSDRAGNGKARHPMGLGAGWRGGRQSQGRAEQARRASQKGNSHSLSSPASWIAARLITEASPDL